MTQIIKIYFKNSKNQAHIQQVATCVRPKQLYKAAAQLYGIDSENIHLYHKAILIGKQQQFIQSLQQKSIIHLVNLTQVNKQELQLNIIKLNDRTSLQKIQVPSSMTVKQTLDNYIKNIFGKDSTSAFLVNIGRQLNFQRTLKQCDVQNGAQIRVVTHQDGQIINASSKNNNEQRQKVKNQKKVQYKISVNQVPDQDQQITERTSFKQTFEYFNTEQNKQKQTQNAPPKQQQKIEKIQQNEPIKEEQQVQHEYILGVQTIPEPTVYQSPNFPIKIPTEIDASNKIEFLYNSSENIVQRAPDVQVPPEQVIPQQPQQLVKEASEDVSSQNPKQVQQVKIQNIQNSEQKTLVVEEVKQKQQSTGNELNKQQEQKKQ